MTLKQTLENNIFYVVAGASLAAGIAGWSACHAIFVTSKSEMIAQLEKRVTELSQQTRNQEATLDPYRKEIARLLGDNQKLESDLMQTRGALKQWQESLAGWQSGHKELQAKLKIYAANCSIFDNIRGLQERKDQMEHWVENATLVNSSEHRKLEDYRRIASEFHARITHLQEKVSCEREN